MSGDDEFAEFDTDEATFDAMFGAAEPAELVHVPRQVTIRSVANDSVTFSRGLPISVSDTSATAVVETEGRRERRMVPGMRVSRTPETVAG